jgi:hypothetical protein
MEADLPMLEKLAHTHAQNDRLVILSLALDESTEDAAAFVKQHHLSWPQGHLGDLSQNQTLQSYALRRFPSYFLIDPEGTLLAKDLDAAALEAAVEAALK